MIKPPIDKLYYIASPYTSDIAIEVETRYLRTLELDTALMNMQYCAISPILLSHQQAQRFKLPGNFEYYRDRDLLLLDRCDGVIVFLMGGTFQSHGVKNEILHAVKTQKPIYLFDGREFQFITPEMATSWYELEKV